MVQTRNQKKQAEIDMNNNLKKQQEEIASKEKIAVETLLTLSEQKNEFDNYSDSEINEARMTLARKKCIFEQDKYDKPMSNEVKYSPYNGSIEEQMKESFKNKDMKTYKALREYKNNMKKYSEIQNFHKNNFNKILANISEKDILKYLKEKTVKNDDKKVIKPDEDQRIYLCKIKEEKHYLQELKDIKDLIKVRQEIIELNHKGLVELQDLFNEKLQSYLKKFSC